MSSPVADSTTPVVIVVGPPGAGKTTVGRLLAAELGVAFRDNDADIEAAAGKSIGDMFVDDGEAAFRAMEAAGVARLLREFDGVASLGGGAILAPATRELLAGHRVLYLRVSLSDAIRRVGMAQSRPVLTLNPRAAMRELLEQRTPLYESVATITVDTDGRSPDDVVADAREKLEVLL